jgi:phosphate transport system substrate-binding protein
MISRFAAIALMLVAATSACSRQAEQGSPAGSVLIDGSPGVLPLMQPLVDSFMARNPMVKVELRSGLGSGPRIDSVASGAIDVAMASHGIIVDSITARGLTVHEIARTPVVFAVHSSVPVTALSRAQVCDILAGKATNWNQVGGPDAPIAALMRPAGEVDADVATAAIDCMKGLKMGAKVTMIDRPDSMAATLARTTGGFGVTSRTMVDQSGGAMKVVSLDGVAPDAAGVESGSYALARQSFLVTKATPSAAVSRLLEFIRSADGAGLIRANGAVPGR